LSIQAFQPKLIEGKAIQLHPLVCTAFNADFDGDQMAVHVPLSSAAVLEAQLLMLSSHNILNPQNGTPITLPSQDMVLGLYYITKGKKSTAAEKVKGEGKAFYSAEEVIIAYNEGRVDLHAFIKVRTNVRTAQDTIEYKLLETTVGRVLFNQHVPVEVGFVNALLTKKSLREIIGNIIKWTNIPKTVKFLDDIKQLGFRMAFRGGLSFNINDLIIPDTKEQQLDNAKVEVDEVWENYNMGLITNN
jgi:DNA-directed RNA polymerase subunit beta'